MKLKPQYRNAGDVLWRQLENQLIESFYDQIKDMLDEHILHLDLLEFDRLLVDKFKSFFNGQQE